MREEFVQEISVEELLSRYSKMLYRLAYSRTQNKHDAEDIVQEVLLKYIKSNVTFHDEEHRKAWLLKVAVNTGKSLVTSAWNRHRADLDEALELQNTIEEKSEIYDAVKKLPEKYRMVIHLFYFEELTIQEISSITTTKESTVKSLLRRSREKLKKILKEEQYEF